MTHGSVLKCYYDLFIIVSQIIVVLNSVRGLQITKLLNLQLI